MNYYILFCQTVKTEKVCQMLNRKNNIYAFIPKMEVYMHVQQNIILKTMFPGYLFIQTNMDQLEFETLLCSLQEERDGIIKELKKQQVSALTDEEIQLLQCLLNKNGILKMSEGYKVNGITKVISGPLAQFQDCIIDTDKRDMIAVLNIKFLDRHIKAGLLFR